MKGWIGRWIMAPFFTGCKSGSGVAVATRTCPNRQLPSSSPRKKEERTKNTITVKTRNSLRPTFQFRKPNISRGIHRLFRSIRNVSPVFGYREEKEEEVEMEIGFPTDVKHLTHIGCDGSMITTIDKGESEIESRGRWDQMEAPESMSLPSISHEQLEMAMAAQVSCTKDTIEVDEFVLPHSSIC